ncbi:MAG: ATP-dependent DNA helicase [Clostridia bacterium]|nr:ATP-dependent DNA helicase [Clostridia bacterium]
MDKYRALKKYFGYTSFRQGQEQIIDSILSGRDTVGVLPTGTGKSVCYQLPAVMLKGVTLVISPLISLMNDQVKNLNAKNIKALALNSLIPKGKTERLYKSIINGEYTLLYVAPERLFNEGFLKLCGSIDIPLAVVDEAHCVCQWGMDFRPEYLKIADFIARLPKRPCVAAFTASATPDIRSGIEKILKLNEPCKVVTGFDRPNLFFDVIQTGSKLAKTAQLLKKKQGSKIVYCSTRRQTDEIYNYLTANGFNAASYHAGLDSLHRQNAREKFISGEKEIIVATNAFGMGIDKPDVRLVLHYNMPPDVESYYQQAGRAGRDGLAAECILLYSPPARKTHEFLIENSETNPELDKKQQDEHKAMRYKRLDDMELYCRGNVCFRKYILNYFGQESDDECDYCGYCGNNKTEKEEAGKEYGLRNTDAQYLAALKAIRKKAAKSCHIPGRLLVSDYELKKIVRTRPDNFDELEKYCSFSSYQLRKIGIDIIKICNLY